MYAGDQGPLTVTRTNAVNGLEPSSATPLREEMKEPGIARPGGFSSAGDGFLIAARRQQDF